MTSEIIKNAVEALVVEAAALQQAADRIGEPFDNAIKCLAQVKGRIVSTGLGKSGHVARKVAATLASTGSPSFFLHPVEALHGDLGMIGADDAVLAFAYGGETQEVLEVVKYAKRCELPVVAITGKVDSVGRFMMN